MVKIHKLTIVKTTIHVLKISINITSLPFSWWNPQCSLDVFGEIPQVFSVVCHASNHHVPPFFMVKNTCSTFGKQKPSSHLPSGKLTVQPWQSSGLEDEFHSLQLKLGYFHYFSWENPLFLWPFSIVMLVMLIYQRVTTIHNHSPPLNKSSLTIINHCYFQGRFLPMIPCWLMIILWGIYYPMMFKLI